MTVLWELSCLHDDTLLGAKENLSLTCPNLEDPVSLLPLSQLPQDTCWPSYSKLMAPDTHLKGLMTEVLLNGNKWPWEQLVPERPGNLASKYLRDWRYP